MCLEDPNLSSTQVSVFNHDLALLQPVMKSRAQCHVHLVRLDAEILYINLSASLARKSNQRTMSGTGSNSGGPLPTRVWAPWT